MEKFILFLLFLSTSLIIIAQTEVDVLTDEGYTARVGSMCVETIKPDPCAGTETYLTLNFEEELVLVTDTEISTCGSASINSKLAYKWELMQDAEIKIYSNAEKLGHKFLEDLVLKVKNRTVIGIRPTWASRPDTIVFSKIAGK